MEYKKCSKCGSEKVLSKYRKDKRASDGLRSQCADCEDEDRLTRDRTEIGVIKGFLRDQRTRSKKRGHKMPTYTFDELSKWVLNNPKWNTLLEKWEESNYETKHKPSIDRKDNTRGYSFDNIQLITWEDNFKNAKNDQKNGVLNSGNELRPVIKLSLNGEYISEYISVRGAGRENKINYQLIYRVCKGRRKSTGGFKWKYKTGKL